MPLCGRGAPCGCGGRQFPSAPGLDDLQSLDFISRHCRSRRVRYYAAALFSRLLSRSRVGIYRRDGAREPGETARAGPTHPLTPSVGMVRIVAVAVSYAGRAISRAWRGGRRAEVTSCSSLAIARATLLRGRASSAATHFHLHQPMLSVHV